MKRPRNVDCGKIRRPLKRRNITDGIYGSTFLYLRFLLVWALVLMADFILEFRFEYLWPFWLLIRSVYDSFKYQGLAFSVIFVCIAVTSDVICYLFIPVQWLFFAASTYVWVQYVWHTERGICLPTVSLWLLFVYIEASIRLRELKSLPFNLDLCRPFACHCIGYPVVTLGFGFKSYVSYKMRLRRQKVIQKENDFYLQILQQALPSELQYGDKPKALPSKSEEDVFSNGTPVPKKVSSSSKVDEEKESSSSSTAKSKSSKGGADINEDDELEYIEKTLPKKSPNNINQFDESADNFANEQQAGKAYKSGNNVTNSVNNVTNSSLNASNKTSSKQLNSSKDSVGNNSSSNTSSTHSSSSVSKKGKNMYKDLQSSPSQNTYTNNKEEVIVRLETDVKKLKADLQASRNCEHELRSHISSSSSEEKAMRSELYQLQQDNENLQNRLHHLVTSRQQDKQSIVSFEKRLAEEKKARQTLEQQLATEKKNKSVAEAQATARAVAIAAAARNECSDSCKARRREFDNEAKQLRREYKLREDQYRQLEREVQSLRQMKEDSGMLVKALTTMREKNAEMENNLCAETRFKQDLFSALNKERNEIKVLQNNVADKDGQILELKSKIAEVMALIPTPASTTYQHHTNERNSSPLFSSGFSNGPNMTSNLPAVMNGTDLASSSELNPNASDYTPKSAI